MDINKFFAIIFLISALLQFCNFIEQITGNRDKFWINYHKIFMALNLIASYIYVYIVYHDVADLKIINRYEVYKRTI